MPAEAYYSKKLIETLKSAGIHCHKASDRFTSGIPDIYVAGGNWIETKKVPLAIGRGNHNVLKHFSSNQIQFAKRYTASGDLVLLYIIFYDSKTGACQYYMIAPYPFFAKYHFWNYSKLREWAKINDGKIDISDVFDKTQTRNQNRDGLDDFYSALPADYLP